MGDSENRRATRVSYPCEVECTGVGQNPLNPRISDLSATGAFIDSMNAVPVGSKMKLKFTLPTGNISVNAEVVHAMEHFGMGVRFLDLSDEQRGFIEQFVAGAS
jgi:c-di-GMP-binding flagellar brake protein YcgR